MSKGKVALLVVVAFCVGLLVGWLWASAHTAAPVPMPQSKPPVLPLPSVMKGDIRFTVFRAGQLQTRDEKGDSHWLRSFEIVIENLKNPQASMDSLEIDQVKLFQGGKELPEPVRTKMNDKFTMPPGLPATVSENALVLSCFQKVEKSEVAEQPEADNGSPAEKPFEVRFTYGPSKIAVALGPVLFP